MPTTFSDPPRRIISKVVSLKKRIQNKRSKDIWVILKKRAPLFLYLLWIASGTAFYALYEELPLHLALYQSTSVGWAIGWAIPGEDAHNDSYFSTIFSSFHNLVGVLFVGIIVLYIEIAVSKTKDNWMVAMTNRQGVEYEVPTTLWSKLMRWMKSHKDRVKIYMICFNCCFLCIIFGYYSIGSFSFAESCDMTLSTLSCSGYQGMPLHAGKWAYIFLALFTNVAVPLFLVATGTLASIMMNKQDEKSFYKKIAAPLTDVELKYMQYFGIEDGDGVLDKKEFLILIIIRIGNIKPGNVVDIHKHFKQLTINTGGTISYSSILGSEDSDEDNTSPPKTPLSQPRPLHTLQMVPAMFRGFRQSSSFSTWGEGEGESVDGHDEQEKDKEKDKDKDSSSGSHNPTFQVGGKKIRLPLLKLSLSSLLHPRKGRKTTPIEFQKPCDDDGDDDNDESQDISNISSYDSKDKDKDKDESKDSNSRMAAPLCPPPSYRAKAKFSFKSPFSGRRGGKMSQTVVPVVEASDGSGEQSGQEERDRKSSSSCSSRTQIHPSSFSSSSSSSSSVTPTPSPTAAPPLQPHISSLSPLDESKAIISLQQDTKTSPDRSPDPFVRLVRQFSRRESTDDPEDVMTHLPTSDPPLQIEKSNSTASCHSIDDYGECRPPMSSVPSSSSSLSSATTYSKSGRKKFSTRKDRQTSFERTVILLGKSRTMVMDYVSCHRQKRRKKMLRRSTAFGLQKISEAHTALEEKNSVNRMLSDDAKLCTALRLLVMDYLKDSYVQAFIFWFTWLMVGGLFYSYNMNMSFYRGFYMSVNVGYAIYWTTEEDSTSTKAFSVLNVILGQLVTTVAMAFFAGRLKQHWYAEAEEKVKLDTVSENSNIFYYNLMKVLFFMKRNHVHCLSILWLIFGVVWSLFAIEWSFLDALYFSITSLSTGGFWPIPEDSPDLYYFTVAVFTCTGAPILCLSAGIFAYYLCRLSRDSDFIEAMNSPITVEELEMMQVLDIDDDDGHIDMTEYVVLILIRIKAVQPELIAAVIAHFKDIDQAKQGEFTYEKLFAPAKPNNSIKIKTVVKSMMNIITQDSNDD
jgi:hypothetical protein